MGLDLGKVFYQRLTYTLADGELREIHTFAKFFKILSNTGATDIDFSLGGQTFYKIPAGISIELPAGDQMTNIRLQNNTGGVATVDMVLSNGRVIDDRNIISGTVVVDSSGSTINTPAKITATNVAAAVSIPANTSRKAVIIYNNHATNIVWIGDANVNGSTLRGIPINPGESPTINTKAAIYTHSPSGNADLSYMEVY